MIKAKTIRVNFMEERGNLPYAHAHAPRTQPGTHFFIAEDLPETLRISRSF